MPDQPHFHPPTPRLIVTIGLHGSASTWVYNIARELMIAARGEEQAAAIAGESVQAVVADSRLAGRYVVWKAHHGGPDWEVFAWLSRATVVLSVRDPRDAAVSMMRRFAVEATPALRGIAQDCRRALQCADAGCPVLRYEDRFFDDPTTVAMLARLIGAEVPAETEARIFERYRTAAVRAFADNLEALPAERLRIDPVTQILRGHIGDGRIGKWREHLDPAQQREATAYFAPFLERFGYSA
jgi:hypothetical protein